MVNPLINREQIEIFGPFGPMPIQAYRLRELAVHETLSDKGRWTITHLPTGLSFGFAFAALPAALGAMEDLHLLRSWRCSARDIEADGPKIYRVLTKWKGQKYSTAPRSAAAKGLNGYA